MSTIKSLRSVKFRLRSTTALKAMSSGAAVSGLGAGVAFVSNILIARELGPSARGQVAFVLQTAYLLSPLFTLGADKAALRLDGTQSPGNPRRHLIVTATVATALLFLLFGDWRASCGLIAYSLAWIALVRSISFRQNSFRQYLKLIVGYHTTVLAFAVALFLMHVDFWVAWLLPYAVPAIVMLGYDVIRQTRDQLTRPFSAVQTSSLRFLPGSFAAMVATRADRVLMPVLSTNAQLGIYIAVATATESIIWLATSLADHRVARMTNSRSFTNLLRMLIRDLFLFTVVAALVAYAIAILIIPLLGAGFTAGQGLLLPLSLAAVILALYRQVVSWVLAGPTAGAMSIIEVSTAVCAIPVYAVLISRYGAIGAAWGSAIAYLVGLSISLVVARRSVMVHAEP